MRIHLQYEQNGEIRFALVDVDPECHVCEFTVALRRQLGVYADAVIVQSEKEELTCFQKMGYVVGQNAILHAEFQNPIWDKSNSTVTQTIHATNYHEFKIARSVLSSSECKGFVRICESMGFTPCERYAELFVQNPALAEILFDRVKHLLQREIHAFESMWSLVGLSPCFRVYRFQEGEYFLKHIDLGYRENPNSRSFFTLQITLNEDFEGGEVRFYISQISPADVTLHVECGMLLFFNHQTKALLFDTEPIRKGTKYMLRTDAMYEKQE